MAKRPCARVIRSLHNAIFYLTGIARSAQCSRYVPEAALGDGLLDASSVRMVAKRSIVPWTPCDRAKNNPTRTSFTVKLGNWFEARAEGWGVAVMPTLFILLALLAAAHVVVT